MALSVSISKTTGEVTTTKLLRAERVTHNFDRSVNPNPLPSGTEGTAGQTFYLDLGQVVQTIIIEGLVDVAETTGEATKSTLETIMKTWYVQYSLGGDNSPASITIPGGTYNGFFKNASFTMLGALEDRWQYSILFLVAS